MIQTLTALYILAGLDAMFSGICAASGRNALINKRGYFARSMVYGFFWGQIVCLVGLTALIAVAAFAGDREQVIEEMVSVGQRMAVVYMVYAAIVLSTFVVRAIPSVDVRSITSVVGFGPLTIIRPAVIVAGIAWGLALAPSPGVVIATMLIAGMMIPFRTWLNLLLDFHGDQVLYTFPHLRRGATPSADETTPGT